MKTAIIYAFLLVTFTNTLIAQTGTIKGIVKNEKGIPIQDVNVSFNEKGTTTNSKGEYQLQISSGKYITVIFSHIAHNTLNKRIRVSRNRTVYFSPKLSIKTELIDSVVIKNNRDKVQGIDKIDIKTAQNLPSANAGFEGTLKNIGLGVSGNNELSTQYNVRGGNYDENLVYVNGIEVYRPFLVRSGQQEGLSFVNPNLTQNVRFSAGGFQV